MFIGSLVCFGVIRRRWLQLLITMFLAFAGFAFLSAATFGVAMGSGHGTHRGPSADELPDTILLAWPILAGLALVIAWSDRRRVETLLGIDFMD